MNRLIILGNGFDLAHGLRTSYNDFMEYFWSNICIHNGSGLLTTEYPYEFIDTRICKSQKQFLSVVNIPDVDNNGEFINKSTGHFVRFNNNFFKQINKSHSHSNWVDIEVAYYRSLRQIAKMSGEHIDQKIKRVKILNREVSEITKCFETYLNKMVVPEIDKSENEYFKKFFAENTFIMGFSMNSESTPIRSSYDSTFILNFNYTKTFELYNEKKSVSVNIHGELENRNNNSVLLGFGDEMDEDYRLLEKMNIKEFMTHMKSFHYFQNQNYTSLMNFLDRSRFDIEIVGHSLGVSDRTLLSTVFNHEKCNKVRIHFYQYINKETELSEDNFTELTINASRHFTDKIKMRSKIVFKDPNNLINRNLS